MDDELIVGVFLTRVPPLLMAATLLLCLCLRVGRLRRPCSSWSKWNGALDQTKFCVSASIEIGEFVSRRDRQLSPNGLEAGLRRKGGVSSRINRCRVRKDDGRASMGQRQC